MNFTVLEMLYNIPELQRLSYQLYLKMPDRTQREEELRRVQAECDAISTPELARLFDRLAEAESYVSGLQERACFFAGISLGWGLSQILSDL